MDSLSDDRLDALDGRLDDLGDRLDALDGSDGRLDALHQWVKAIDDHADGRLDALGDRLDALDGGLDALADHASTSGKYLDSIAAFVMFSIPTLWLFALLAGVRNPHGIGQVIWWCVCLGVYVWFMYRTYSIWRDKDTKKP